MRRILLPFLFYILLCLHGCSKTDDKGIENTGSGVIPTPVSSPVPSPDPLPTGIQLVTTTFFENFENGWGSYLDGGLFVGLSSEKVYAGTNSVKLFAANGVISSFFQRTPMDLTRARNVTIDFWMYGEDLNDGDALLVDFSDGTQWQTLKRLVKGEDFGNGSFSEFSITISPDDFHFSQAARVCFVGSTAENPIYIDDISITVESEDVVTSLNPDFGPGSFTYDHIGVNAGCSGCHDNRIWQGKYASHITSSDECQLCHLANNVNGWDSLTYDTGTFDHTNVENQCFGCHNFILAAGKPPLHIDSANECEQCHSTSIGGWNLLDPGQTYLHEGVVTGCVSCHGGGISQGKGVNHILSSDNCESCHTPNLEWSNTIAFDHSNLIDNCQSCHDGIVAQGKNEFHIPSNNNCESCHSPDGGWFLTEGESFDHGEITTGCVACHNGVSTVGKSIDHLPASDTCESCHLVGEGWGGAALFNHEDIVGGCVSCHNNLDSQGKSAFHISSSANCETCHKPNQGWLVDVAAGFDHEAILGNCVTCHNSETTEGKNEQHVESHDRCEECHSPLNNWVEIF